MMFVSEVYIFNEFFQTLLLHLTFDICSIDIDVMKLLLLFSSLSAFAILCLYFEIRKERKERKRLENELKKIGELLKSGIPFNFKKTTNYV